ncbi:hypothetical protein [Streptomyces sp. NPDC059783]|uniref:hypothetical protein n=1 Tax=Streptomyces sp. NPDC059783 TaxID=3346944 RepID=UPI003655A2B7
MPAGVRIDQTAGERRRHVEITEDGLRLANGKLTRLIAYCDSLTSLVDRGDTDDAVWTLRRAKSTRRRPTP